jgi:hypothetical protein
MKKTILVLAANPKDTSRLRLEQEVREIDNGLQRAKKRDEFILKQVWAVRPVDVRRAMLDFRPNIIHFCGHGAGEEGIAFEDETGFAKFIDAETLADFFELFANQIECIVLNACYSEVQASKVARHINYVIGMKREIGDSAAIEFAIAFYDALGAGESIEFAYKLARNAIRWAGISEHLTPIIKSKSSFRSLEKRFENKAIRAVLRIKMQTLYLWQELVKNNRTSQAFSAQIRNSTLAKVRGDLEFLMNVGCLNFQTKELYVDTDSGDVVHEIRISDVSSILADLVDKTIEIGAE